MEQHIIFPFMDLPQLVQEMITDEIVRKLDFIDRKQFILTSKYCNWLIQQSKMKKRIKIKRLRFEDEKLICEISDKNVLRLSTEEEMIKGTIDLYFNPKSRFHSPIKDFWLDAMEFLENFVFILNDKFSDGNVEIASKLNHLKFCHISNYLSSEKLLNIVDAFPKLPNLIIHGIMDDELLKLLASKSNSLNPLKKLKLVSFIGFSIDAVEHFFKHATFVNKSLIDLKIDATLLKIEKFKRIDKYEVILIVQEEKKIEMMLKKIDEKIRITVAITLDL
uniref:F-box domain-containing protein n=1 Tax=Panagrolaimus sp. JU765 TaxID=591449 RepID=A0AC34PZV6_9BILA